VSITNIECTGASGMKYLYYPTMPGSTWLDKPGNYLFCKWNARNWVIQYAGECQSFSTRIPTHERWGEAVRDYGVTMAFSHVTQGGVDARQREERDLIQAYNPPMNIHHRTNALGDVAGALGQIGGLSPLGQSLLNGKR
jgi:hypothetical protein